MPGQFDNIQQNAFYQIVFNDRLEPSAKLAAVGERLSFDNNQSSEQNLAKLKDFQFFKAYLAHDRKRLGEEIARIASSPDKSEVIHQARNIMNGLQSIYAILHEGAQIARGAAAETTTFDLSAGFEGYSRVLAPLAGETKAIYGAMAADVVRLKQLGDAVTTLDKDEVNARLADILRNGTAPVQEELSVEVSLDKPMTVSRRTLRFKPPAMA